MLGLSCWGVSEHGFGAIFIYLYKVGPLLVVDGDMAAEKNMGSSGYNPYEWSYHPSSNW